MLSCIVQVASILFLPEFFCYYNNLYILQPLVRILRRKNSLSHNHNTSHFSIFQSGPFSYMPFESIGIHPLWDVRIRTRMIQFNTHHFKLITITHKNTLLTGCPVKRVHIIILACTFFLSFFHCQ